MKLGIIGGTGLADCDAVDWHSESTPATRFGPPSAPIREGLARNGAALGQGRGGKRLAVAFLPRHGQIHSIAPHLINYRANIAALQAVGVTHIVAVNSVGGLTSAMQPAALVVPDQIIDYSYGRAQSFYDGVDGELRHVDFTWPFSNDLRGALLQAAASGEVACIDGGTYACTQGPRLETAAEVRRLIGDGCDLVGMTAMPEAVLARELDLHYACLALVVNWGAGLSAEPILMEDIGRIVAAGAGDINKLLQVLMIQLAAAQ
ncbi:S-methyl-5'-thioinosine phosphorylase [Pseudomaricurvus alcaniphilus]|uniref:S-methyl-5'-thioinosine phosphorylase n=1 Tax=Pseudomaricurvus alcaniphilus TaxID=1166482 RepID=UPI00140E779D|nr:S-methyl-5'-thioinosine phosphorylase [Pseudomaricurvus alcaniphilus]NHN35962.1 S-methyl-5'-thioinosine phosphorylase [Pseudomaricurvus alcaniphilus]